MNKFFESLRPFIRSVVRNAGWVLLIAALFAAVGGYYASSLKIDTDFSKLIPEDYPSYQALERVRNTVGGEGSDLAVGIVSPSFEANKAFAEDLIPKALKLTGEGYKRPYLRTVEYHRDTEFMENNALYFATDRELNNIESYLEDEIEQAKLEANPFYTDFGLEDEEVENDTSLSITELDSVYQQLVGKEYPVSDDSTTMTVRFFPEGSQTDVSFINDLYADFEKLLDQMNPQSYHPEMEITLAGRLLRRSIQIEAIRGDVAKTFGIGASAVLLLVILYFLYKSYTARVGKTFSGKVLLTELARMPVLALTISIPLLMSLAWTFGVAYLAIGNLNIMTSTLALLLFGLGIDFGVHFYGRYSEERGNNSIIDAAEISFVSTGQAVTVGALTTSAALLVLTMADFKGFSEFGFIAGIGIIFAVIAMIVILPAVLALFERLNLLNLTATDEAAAIGIASEKRFPANRIVLVFSIAAVIGSIVMLPSVSFEYDFSELEPTYPEYEAKDEIVDRVSSSRRGSNPAYIVVDSSEEAVKVAEAVREKARNDTTSPTIKEVQTLQERFPLQEEEKKQRLQQIAEIRELLHNQFLQSDTTAELQRLRRAAQTQEPISVEQVPDYLKDAFTTQSGEIGKFVMIYPSVGLSDGRKSMAFASDVGTIETEDGEEYHAGSTSIIGAEMLRLMQEESPWMITTVFIIVALLMLAYFKSIRWAALALVPLIVGILWMLLVIEFFGPKLNFFNLVVLPAMLGIGNDDGVHIVHRYQERGPGSIMKVLRSTGEHCTIASLTTMIGFFGLLFSFHPGLRSIGQLAVVGATTTLLAALVFLPALIQWLEDRASAQKAKDEAEKTEV